VIKEISHLVGDPHEVDEQGLKSEGMVRVLCKDAIQIEGFTMVFINGQGHLIKWLSEKLQEQRKTLWPSSTDTRDTRKTLRMKLKVRKILLAVMVVGLLDLVESKKKRRKKGETWDRLKGVNRRMMKGRSRMKRVS
jgi:hypothetical protein